MKRKHGKSETSSVGNPSLSNGHNDHGSTDASRSPPSDPPVSTQRDSHLSRQNSDSAHHHHPLEEGERVEHEEEEDLLQEQGIFELTYGYIYYGKGKPKSAPLPDENSPLDRPTTDEEDAAAAETSKNSGGPTFQFTGRNCNNSINLFGNQMFKLIRELRKAYKAYHQSDDSYQFVVVENKTHRVTLEVSLYKEKTYLFLKRYFKNRDGYGPYAGNTDPDAWLPTKGVVSLDPQHDDPAKMLRYVLRCCK